VFAPGRGASGVSPARGPRRCHWRGAGRKSGPAAWRSTTCTAARRSHARSSPSSYPGLDAALSRLGTGVSRRARRFCLPTPPPRSVFSNATGIPSTGPTRISGGFLARIGLCGPGPSDRCSSVRLDTNLESPLGMILHIRCAAIDRTRIQKGRHGIEHTSEPAGRREGPPRSERSPTNDERRISPASPVILLRASDLGSTACRSAGMAEEQGSAGTGSVSRTPPRSGGRGSMTLLWPATFIRLLLHDRLGFRLEAAPPGPRQFVELVELGLQQPLVGQAGLILGDQGRRGRPGSGRIRRPRGPLWRTAARRWTAARAASSRRGRATPDELELSKMLGLELLDLQFEATRALKRPLKKSRSRAKSRRRPEAGTGCRRSRSRGPAR